MSRDRATRKVTIVWSSNTHKLATRALRQWLMSDAAEVQDLQIEPNDHLAQYEPVLSETDCLIVSSGGVLLNQIINWLEARNLCPTVVSIFPGIVLDDQIEAFITRVRADIVLLNSKNNYDRHRAVCSALRVRFNGFLAGPLWSDLQDQEIPVESDSNWIFAEQDLLPDSRSQTENLARDLVSIASRNPHESISVLPHPRQNESRLMPEIERVGRPENLDLLGRNGADDWNKIKGVVSLSSAMLLLAIMKNRRAIVLSGYGVPREHRQFYQGSNLIRSAQEIDLTQIGRPNPGWVERNIALPWVNLGAVRDLLYNPHQKIGIVDGALAELRITASLFGKFWRSPLEFRRRLRLAMKIIHA